MIIFLSCLLTVGVLVFILSVRAKDLPEAPPVSPFQHLDDRKASIYENLRDLQFEFRLNKMSEADYQSAKAEMQKELAKVLAEIDRVRQQLTGKVPPTPKAAPASSKFVCASCKAEFLKPMKFCGECGKPMEAA